MTKLNIVEKMAVNVKAEFVALGAWAVAEAKEYDEKYRRPAVEKCLERALTKKEKREANRIARQRRKAEKEFRVANSVATQAERKLYACDSQLAQMQA